MSDAKATSDKEHSQNPFSISLILEKYRAIQQEADRARLAMDIAAIESTEADQALCNDAVTPVEQKRIDAAQEAWSTAQQTLDSYSDVSLSRRALDALKDTNFMDIAKAFAALDDRFVETFARQLEGVTQNLKRMARETQRAANKRD